MWAVAEANPQPLTTGLANESHLQSCSALFPIPKKVCHVWTSTGVRGRPAFAQWQALVAWLLVVKDRWPGCKVVEACHSETDHGALQIIHSQQPNPKPGPCFSAGAAKVWVSVLIDSSGIRRQPTSVQSQPAAFSARPVEATNLTEFEASEPLRFKLLA